MEPEAYLRQMGLPVRTADANELFDSWDSDRSGTLEMIELYKILRRGGAVIVPTPRKDLITQAELQPFDAARSWERLSHMQGTEPELLQVQAARAQPSKSADHA